METASRDQLCAFVMELRDVAVGFISSALVASDVPIT